MAHTKSVKPLSFALSYGFMEGPAHGHKISKLLNAAGFRPAKNIDEADIIIAHSAGCWLLPSHASPKIMLYVGMPLPHTNSQKTWLKANWLGLRILAGKGDILAILRSGCLSAYYSLRHLRRTLGIIRGNKTAKPVVFPGSITIFITNHYDPWPQSARLDDYVNGEGWSFLSMPGTHSYIWRQPSDFVDLIKHYANLLA